MADRGGAGRLLLDGDDQSSRTWYRFFRRFSASAERIRYDLPVDSDFEPETEI